MVTNTELVAAKMQILRGIGVGMALDDFGTGYSSLGYLRRLPLTQLKIDRSFVQEVTENERSASLARSIIQLGRDLDLSVLAEGVETAEQFAFLREGGCEEFQGFYFGRPMPLAAFENGLVRKVA
jgi:EAL domain-containing protein (putative c-di-GMP-specific phosphodiesterase class I)